MRPKVRGRSARWRGGRRQGRIVLSVRVGNPVRQNDYAGPDRKEGEPADILDHGPYQRREPYGIAVSFGLRLYVFPSNIRLVSGPILTS